MVPVRRGVRALRERRGTGTAEKRPFTWFAPRPLAQAKAAVICVEFVRLRKDTRSALNGSDVWEELRERRKAFNPGEFNRKVLLHNLRDNDYGCPISEIRDSFWSNPHKPLLPTGASELQDATYDAIAQCDIELINPDGVVYPVHARNDINLAANNIRVRSATSSYVETPHANADATPPALSAGVHPKTAPAYPAESGTFDPQPAISGTKVKHWQLTLNINTSVNSGDPDDGLVHLLRELSNRLEEGKISHINQTTQITISGEQDTAETLEDLAKEAGSAVNIIPL